MSFKLHIKGINAVGDAAVVGADITGKSGLRASIEGLLQIQVGIEDITVNIQITILSTQLIAWIGQVGTQNIKSGVDWYPVVKAEIVLLSVGGG